LEHPSLVPDQDLTFGPHGHQLLSLRERRHQHELKVPKRMAQYHFDLQVGVALPHAGVLPCAEPRVHKLAANPALPPARRRTGPSGSNA
jgi:hypothetical protein